MDILHKIKEYVILSRIYFAGFIAIMPVVGALSANFSIGWMHLLILFTIGIFMHLYAYLLNEWIDYEIDKRSKYLKEKPLISGTIPRHHALIMGIVAVLISISITTFYFNITTIVILLVTIALVTSYDLTNKKIKFNEFFQSSSALSFCLFGAISTGINVTNISFFTWMIAIAFFLLFFSASISCGVGLKDIENDIRNKAVTIPILFGVHISKNKIEMPLSYIVLSYLIKILFFYTFFIMFLFSIDYLKFWYIGVMLIIISVLVMYMFHFFYTIAYKTYTRRKLLRLGKIHEVSAYILFPVILIPSIGVPLAVILLVVPFAWGLLVRHGIYKERLYH